MRNCTMHSLNFERIPRVGVDICSLLLHHRSVRYPRISLRYCLYLEEPRCIASVRSNWKRLTSEINIRLKISTNKEPPTSANWRRSVLNCGFSRISFIRSDSNKKLHYRWIRVQEAYNFLNSPQFSTVNSYTLFFHLQDTNASLSPPIRNSMLNRRWTAVQRKHWGMNI